MVIHADFWSGKRVFVTGHTGFKGSWLCLWLQSMGAKVYGYALDPPTEPNLFTVANVATGMTRSECADIRDAAKLTEAMKAAKAEIVFHLAAQPLVRYSYGHPVETYAVNVMGTVNVLEAVRATVGVRAVLNVTTDKCYDNREWVRGYREDDALGGLDPYSSSKGCSELVTAAYRRSFLQGTSVALASARAGNVIGGGDWAEDRLVPDFLRAMDVQEVLTIRFPDSIRPWQHVLEPLSGYLVLAQHLYARPREFSEAWNFGSEEGDARSVRWVVECLAQRAPHVKWQYDATPQPHEAQRLKLDSNKARTRLAWRPKWPLETALSKTIAWHQAWCKGEDMREITSAQIVEYQGSGAPSRADCE